MKAIQLQKIVDKDGELTLTGLPCKQGEQVELFLLIRSKSKSKRPLSAQALLDSPVIGMWKDRKDFKDSPAFARHLREQAQHRQV